MKRIAIFAILVSSLINLFAQTTQRGVVQEYNEKAKKTPLGGVELAVRSAGSTVSDKKGEFALQFLTLKPGEKVNIRRIEKLGYEIFNKEAIEQWNINPNSPFIIVMCRSEKFKKIRDNYEKVSSESYKRQLQKEEAALTKLKADGKLKEAEYQQQLIALRENYEKQLDNLENYVDRFSRIDLSELSAVEQEIIALVQAGKIDEAIDKYEQQNYLDKYKQEVNDIKEVSSAIDQLSEVKASKEQSRDALLASIDRQIETLKLAGGKENFDRIKILLHDIAYADTCNMDNMVNYIDFLNNQNKQLVALSEIKKVNQNMMSPEQKFRFLVLKGGIYKNNSDLSNSLKTYKECDSIAQLQNDSIKIAITKHNIGTLLYEKGDYTNAEALLHQAREIRENLIKNTPDNKDLQFQLSTTYSSIALVYESIRDIEKAITFYHKAIDLQTALYNSNKSRFGMMLANSYNNIANTYQRVMDLENADKYYLKSLEIYSYLYDVNPTSTALRYANTLGNYAALLIALKNFDESKTNTLKAIEIYDNIGKIAPNAVMEPLARAHVNLANLYINIHQFEEASNELKKALQIFEELSKNGDKKYTYEIGTTRCNYAVLLLNLGLLDEAEHQYLEAYNILNQDETKDLNSTLTLNLILNNLGNFYSLYKNNTTLARKYFDENIQELSKFVKMVPQLKNHISMTLNSMAYTYLADRNYESAINTIDEAIALSPATINLYDSKVEIFFKSGKIEEAKQLLESLKEIDPNIEITSLDSYKLIYGQI